MRYFLRNRYVMWLGKRLYTYFLDDIRQVLNENPDITEINALPIRRSELEPATPATPAKLRFNLMIPAVSERHIFGGIATALQFFEGFAGQADDLRIIATDEGVLRDGRMDMERFNGWTFVQADEPDQPGKTIVAVGRRKSSLPVRENDVFIATAWWSAHLAVDITQAQAAMYQKPKRPFIYLIQDYEPLFHPWSARYALAKQTYTDPSAYVPVFNSGLLRDYLVQQKLAKPDALYFDPMLNDSLQKMAKRMGPQPRRRRILVYGRPSVDRNAYPLLVRGLRRLAEQHDISGWEFVSAGEPHASVNLGQGKRLIALGKLSLDDYAKELLQCHAGVSLMISPHPSYPPLEMAAYGMWTITNHYAGKDLSKWAENIRSIDVANADALADTLAEVMGLFGQPAPQGVLDDAYANYLAGHSDLTPLAEQAWAQVQAQAQVQQGHG